MKWQLLHICFNIKAMPTRVNRCLKKHNFESWRLKQEESPDLQQIIEDNEIWWHVQLAASTKENSYHLIFQKGVREGWGSGRGGKRLIFSHLLISPSSVIPFWSSEKLKENRENGFRFHSPRVTIAYISVFEGSAVIVTAGITNLTNYKC